MSNLIELTQAVIDNPRGQVTDNMAQKLLIRIAELEKEASNTNGLWVTSNDLQAWKLEQQAKGVDWVLACRELNLSEGEVHTLMDKCNDLRNQAKTLKEQVK